MGPVKAWQVIGPVGKSLRSRTLRVAVQLEW